MTAEIGLFLLIVALMVSALPASYLVPKMRPYVAPCMLPAIFVQALCITLALVTLTSLRLDNDFTVTNVIAHSNLTLPVLYKVVGTWGNHEGSMVLWAWVLSVFALIFAFGKDHELKLATLSVQSAIAVGTLLFIIFTSNPFERRFPPTIDGEALNPLLQDVALSFHPPMLYLGYVGFSMVFSLAFAALMHGRAGREWAELAHPWILAAWSALTLGIGLGSWWAYRELGWGGWWFWDPVENASLMPWLAGTALLHSNIVLKKRDMLASWVILLAIFTFGLSLLGTFLVRSGALTSVHSFASDPTRGLFILAYIVVVIGSALLLFALRGNRVASAEKMLPVSREGMIVINNLFILTACATVVLGTMYPLLVEWMENSKLTVGPPYFNKTFLPLMAVPLIFAGLVPFMPWKNASFSEAMKRATPALLATVAFMLLVATSAKSDIPYAIAGFGLVVWLAASSAQWLMRSTGVKGAWSVFLGHMGAAVLVAGITGVSLYKQQDERFVSAGDQFAFAGYQLTFAGEENVVRPNYTAHVATLNVADAKGNTLATFKPEYRIYAIRSMPTSEADIRYQFTSDLYAVLGETSKDGKRSAFRLYYVPMIGFIWAGFALIALAGIIAVLRKPLSKVAE